MEIKKERRKLRIIHKMHYEKKICIRIGGGGVEIFVVAFNTVFMNSNI